MRSQVDGRFIGAVGRSGSSLLGDLLAFHPNVTYFHETRFITDPGGLCDYVEGKITANQFKKNFLTRFRPIMLRGIKARGYSTQWYSRQNLTGYFTYSLRLKSRELAAKNFIEALLSWGDIWVEKTPHSIVRVKTLHKIFPDLRYVHMIREPKDIFASLKTKTWGPKTAPDFVKWYNDLMGRAWGQRLKSRQYLVLNLETLISIPELALRKTLDFVGGVSMIADYPIKKALSFISDAHIGRWKRELSQDEIRAIRDCRKWHEKWKGLETLL